MPRTNVTTNKTNGQTHHATWELAAGEVTASVDANETRALAAKIERIISGITIFEVLNLLNSIIRPSFYKKMLKIIDNTN